MKKYDREKKKWVGSGDLERAKKRRDKDICRGQKPHDFVLILPTYVSYDSSYKFNAEEYYRIMDEKYAILSNLDAELRAIGIKNRTLGWNRKETRTYGCSVCKKIKHVFN